MPGLPLVCCDPLPTRFCEDVAALVVDLHPLRQDWLLPADAVRDLQGWAEQQGRWAGHIERAWAAKVVGAWTAECHGS